VTREEHSLILTGNIQGDRGTSIRCRKWTEAGLQKIRAGRGDKKQAPGKEDTNKQGRSVWRKKFSLLNTQVKVNIQYSSGGPGRKGDLWPKQQSTGGQERKDGGNSEADPLIAWESEKRNRRANEGKKEKGTTSEGGETRREGERTEELV